MALALNNLKRVDMPLNKETIKPSEIMTNNIKEFGATFSPRSYVQQIFSTQALTYVLICDDVLFTIFIFKEVGNPVLWIESTPTQTTLEESKYKHSRDILLVKNKSWIKG